MDELEFFTGTLASFDDAILKSTKRDEAKEPSTQIRALPKVSAKWEYALEPSVTPMVWRDK
jgi:hypothetical protein